MVNDIKNVLVLAPHTDDGELGCGGTIAKLLEQNVNVYYAAFSTAEESLPEGFPNDTLKKEVKNATKKLGVQPDKLIIYNFQVRKLNYVRQEILDELVRLKKALEIDLVFMPSLNDVHQDHHTVAEEGLRAFKNITILGYELIWNNLSFNTTSFVKLEKKHVSKKAEALKEYKSQEGRNYMDKDFIFSLAKTRGVQIGCEYAEAFEVIRLVI
ncbi:PIG-L family deacetylase [Vicingus serpentipes]|uniref:PIG-L family deacetylase n=2 Tax=Vicingus serpentipes TaxID=1926625 RepID=A0A5C6RYD2_9FLAO|nr:PIG-L family deacetylase [Vicingus serpentipes]